MTASHDPVVAAFDLDGTITEGGSVFAWLCFVAGTGRTYRKALRLLVPLTIGSIRSGRWADSAKERLFNSLVSGRGLEDIVSLSREFALDHLALKQRAEVVARLNWHHGQGHDIVIVSASPQIYVNFFAESLHALAGLGTRLGVDPRGRLTGTYLGKNCRGQEKMRRLDEWISQQSYPVSPEIYAYGNSRGDRRMLSGATHPYNVGKLGRFGSLRKYPRLKGERGSSLFTPDE
ncbi:MAG: HAD-IB family hydrolase [Acidimicrobiaceae bacterium]|nr:HAD-IB family hydrolase [Acidimicrobiaceae bacterium]